MIKKLFYDLETTGVDVRKHSIHQIAGLIEIGDEVVETFDIKTRPHPKAEITPEALTVCGVSQETIMSYQPMGSAYKDLISLMAKYVDRYDKADKFFMVGFNNSYFDDTFLRAWFEQNNDAFFDAWFFRGSLDVMGLAAEYLIDRRVQMPSFKLSRVCLELGIDVDKTKLHDGVYDVELMRQVYRIVTKREVEL